MMFRVSLAHSTFTYHWVFSLSLSLIWYSLILNNFEFFFWKTKTFSDYNQEVTHRKWEIWIKYHEIRTLPFQKCLCTHLGLINYDNLLIILYQLFVTNFISILNNFLFFVYLKCYLINIIFLCSNILEL